MKIDNILLYEPANTQYFYPFSTLHPIWEIHVGAFRIFEKYRVFFNDSNLLFAGRQGQLASFLARFDFANTIEAGPCLILDSTVYPNKKLYGLIVKAMENAESTNLVFKIGSEIVGALIPNPKIEEITRFISNPNISQFEQYRPVFLEDITKLGYLYDAIFENGNAIVEDAELLRLHRRLADPSEFPNSHFIEPDKILFGKNISIQPGAILDASCGPIILEDNAKIMANAVILGPCFIGNNSVIKIGAKIYPDCSFGQWCKVGGEVENTIIQGYSNKQHEGFLGHSFLCEWVNLGADTNNSDLKNTYSNIKIQLEDVEIDTGKMFLGLLCGDHTKSGINTMFTTGTVAGICGILVREWFLPNFIPSFSWGGAKNSPIYKVAKAIETAKIVMQRRGKTLLAEEENLIIAEYEKVKARNL